MGSSVQIKYKHIPAYKYITVEDEYTINCKNIRPIKQETFECDFLKFDVDGNLTIKVGYAWDGCSGPTHDDKTNMRAGLVHDALYQLMRQGVIERSCQKEADIMLRQIMIEDGMLLAENWRESVLAVTRAWTYYRGVRIAGKKHTKANPEYDKVYIAP